MVRKQQGRSTTATIPLNDDNLRRLAFDNSFTANLITVVSSGRILMANKAARILLGYSKKDLLTKSRSEIFDINDQNFKKMLRQRTGEGQSEARVTAIRKNGRHLTCTITSAVFTDKDGVDKSITTVANLGPEPTGQKNIDIKKDKLVTDQIILAKAKQKKIDFKKARIVADNIAIARLNQRKTDIINEKIVADNIARALAKSDARLEENTQWIKHIAKTSFDVMWDWNIATGGMYVGDTIEEVFGYKVKNNRMNFADFITYLLPAQRDSVEQKLRIALASHKKSWSDAFMLKCYDGTVASTVAKASIVRDKKGRATHMIGNIQDVSKVEALEKKLRMQNIVQKGNATKLPLNAPFSCDGLWEWNLLSNDFFLGEGFKEIFGTTRKTNGRRNNDWTVYLHPQDKPAVEKEMADAIVSTATYWKQGFRMTRTDGSIATVFCRANIIRDENGKAMRIIGAVHDLTRQRQVEKKQQNKISAQAKLLMEYKASFKIILNSSTDVFYDFDLIKEKLTISDAYMKDFGYSITKNLLTARDWVKHIHPADKVAMLLDYKRILTSGEVEWKCRFRFIRADDSVANVLSSGIILREGNGKPYRMIGFIQDTSKQTFLEEKLALEIKLKEQQIVAAMEDAKETERSDIGKELHDNVNQLLGASKLYLDMAKRGSEHSEMYLSRSSEYTQLAIEEIRKLTKGLTTDTINHLGLREAIGIIARDTMEVNKVKISNPMDSFDENSVSNKFKLNIFRIVQEQINNIIKHARASRASISLLQDDKTVTLTIADDGIGFDRDNKGTGIGLANIQSRSASFNGTADFVSAPGKGCVLTVVFPVTSST